MSGRSLSLAGPLRRLFCEVLEARLHTEKGGVLGGCNDLSAACRPARAPGHHRSSSCCVFLQILGFLRERSGRARESVTRSYSSFSEAADENAFSRVLVGLHFRKASEVGVQHGREIGDRAFRLFLRPGH